MDASSTYARTVDWAQDGGYELMLVAPPLAVIVVGLVAYRLQRRWMLIVGCLAIVLFAAVGPVAVMAFVSRRDRR